MDLKQKILADIRVKLTEEFDRNFQRKAFFDRPWKPRATHSTKGSLLMVTGKLRRSIRATQGTDFVQWETSEPYAAIHNFGGDITVTAKMKKFFWYKFKATKDEQWKHMALMKTGAKIHIPKRQFIGEHPSLIKHIEAIARRNMNAEVQRINETFK